MAQGTTSSKASYLITGANGCIGAWIVKNLVEAGNPPVVFDRDPDPRRIRMLLSAEQMGALRTVEGDVTSLDALEAAVSAHRITHIIHLAALQVPACAANPPVGGWVNVVGTLNIFEAARRHRGQVQHITYASSAAVFGPEEFYGSSHVAEGGSLSPSTHYGVFKQCNEGNARVFYESDGISSCGLRPWAVYGPGRDQGITSGPTKAIKAAALGRPYTIRFNGGLDLQYVDDTARIFLRCAEAGLRGARVYTLRGSVVQISEFVKTLEAAFPRARGLVRTEGKQLPIAYDLDDSALVADLGEPPRTALEAGIGATWAVFERLRSEGRLEDDDLKV